MESVAGTWLALQCGMIPGATRGVLLLGGPDGVQTAARWPGNDRGGAADLAAAARRALEEGRIAVEPSGPAGAGAGSRRIAVPFKTTAGLPGAMAVEVREAEGANPAAAAELLRGGVTWLEALTQREHFQERLASVLELVAIALEGGAFRATATAVATELATRLECERVAIGFSQRGHMRVEALSHSSAFEARSQLIRDLGRAMDEAADQDAVIVHPPRRGEPPRIVRAHEQLVASHGSGAVCTVPIAVEREIVGAFGFERRRGHSLDPETLRLCEDATSLLGPLLHLKRRADARTSERLRERLSGFWADLRSPGRPGSKLLAVAGVALPLLLAVAPGTFRVTADATLEGRVQRAIVAGLDGYIAEADARAGDVVERGQLLGSLDSRDLELEHRKWAARREEIRTEHREALADHDRTQVSILSAREAEANAHLALLEELLARTRLLAPFDGVVVQGDLSQSLGSPVTKGEVLFEVAPLDGYRVILKVDERDIAHVREDGSGELVLSALPGQRLPLRVERVTPVSVAESGSNYFRVEARLVDPPDALRPGMEGKAKLEIGRRRLLWIWTHELVAWLRLWLWSWWP